MGLRSLNNGASVGIAKAPVGDDGVIGVVLQFIDSVVSRAGGSDRVTGTFQDGALQCHHVGFVVDAKDLRHGDGLPEPSVNLYDARIDARVSALKRAYTATILDARGEAVKPGAAAKPFRRWT